MRAQNRKAKLAYVLPVALFQGGAGYAARQRSDIVCHQFKNMTILVTLFVAIQLVLGFCALLIVVRPSETTRSNRTIVSYSADDPQTKLTHQPPVIAGRASGLYLSKQCGWQ